MELIAPLIERRHIDAAIAAGACGVEGICVGAPATSLSFSQAVWFEDACPDMAREVLERSGLPLWAWSGSGYGDGYWDGSGDGSGDGYGYGYGSGDGYGYGYGYGYGSGDGSGVSQ